MFHSSVAIACQMFVYDEHIQLSLNFHAVYLRTGYRVVVLNITQVFSFIGQFIMLGIKT